MKTFPGGRTLQPPIIFIHGHSAFSLFFSMCVFACVVADAVDEGPFLTAARARAGENLLPTPDSVSFRGLISATAFCPERQLVALSLWNHTVTVSLDAAGRILTVISVSETGEVATHEFSCNGDFLRRCEDDDDEGEWEGDSVSSSDCSDMDMSSQDGDF